MDSKNVQSSRLADLLLQTFTFAAKVSDIPGASIVSDNVELDLSVFGDEAQVVEARIEDESAALSEIDGVATLDFATAATASSVVLLTVKTPQTL